MRRCKKSGEWTETENKRHLLDCFGKTVQYNAASSFNMDSLSSAPRGLVLIYSRANHHTRIKSIIFITEFYSYSPVWQVTSMKWELRNKKTYKEVEPNVSVEGKFRNKNVYL